MKPGPPDLQSLDHRYRAIRDVIAAAPATAMPTSSRILVALALAGLFTVLATLAASELVYGESAAGLLLAVESPQRLLLTTVGLVALAILCTWAAMSRGAQGLGRGAMALALCAALAPVAYAALTLIDPVHSTAASALVDISPWGVRCIALATLIGGAVLASFTIALHRAAPAAPRLRGAVLGATVGAWSGFAVFVFCPSGDHQHLLIGHVAPVVAFAVVGAIVSARFLRP